MSKESRIAHSFTCRIVGHLSVSLLLVSLLVVLAGCPTGSLKVTIQPSEVVQNGAQWEVTGGPASYSDSGDVISNLSVGAHVVTFTAVDGWTTPAKRTVMITADETVSITGTYTSNEGEGEGEGSVVGGILNVSPPERAVPESSGSTMFTVSNTGTGLMVWSAAVTTGNWLHIPTGQTGETLQVSYDANTGTEARIGQITITAPGAAGSPMTVAVIQPGSSKEMTINLPGNVPLVMRWIAPGAFMMGSTKSDPNASSDEMPQHSVTLTHGFWMGKYEMTQAQWVAIMGQNSNPSYLQPNIHNVPAGTNTNNYPVEQISWNMICAQGGYMEKLNNSVPGLDFRLPTEAEWEYAYRAGTDTRFYWGPDTTYQAIAEYAWYKVYYNSTHEVGGLKPNDWGLYDMAGNVSEWCQDWGGNYPNNSVTDPSGPTSGHYRIFRGGVSKEDCRAAARNSTYPSYASEYRGFRCVFGD